MEELTNTLKSVSLIEEEADFSADPPKEESEQAPSTATDPPTTTDQPADNSTDPTPPPATDTPMPPAADTPSKKPTVGLSSLKALEPLEATEGEGPKPTLVAAKPASKAAAVKKVAKRQRAFLLEGQPTSADEMPPPPLDSFLRMGAKSKSAAKRAPSVSAARAPSVQPKPRGRSLDRSRSQPRITGPPIQPLSPHRPKTAVKPPTSKDPEDRKKPLRAVPGANTSEKSWDDNRRNFLDQTHRELKATWNNHSMAWANLHVSGYYYLFSSLTHPRQLAACSLRGDSKQTERWTCWSCQLEPAKALAAGFSPSKSIWKTHVDQMYHWWEVHAGPSHWEWLAQAEEFQISMTELLNHLLGCDVTAWPFPWWKRALDALPREIPSKQGGLHPALFGPPYFRKEATTTSTRSNRPVSPTAKPKDTSKVNLTELGWVDPIATYSKTARDELTFLLQPHDSLGSYGRARIHCHKTQCPLGRVTDFMLYIEQHAFFLQYIKLVATLALQSPESMDSDLREAALAQVAMCPSQLKDAFHEGVQSQSQVLCGLRRLCR